MNNVKERTSPLTAVIMIPVALIVALPLYYIVVNTFKTQEEMSSSPFALPTQLFLDNYATVFGTVPLVQSFANTLFVTVLSLLLMLIIGSMAAYGMIIGNTRFNRWFGAALILGFIIPSQSTLIPLYRLLADRADRHPDRVGVPLLRRVDLLLLPDPGLHEERSLRADRSGADRRSQRVLHLLADRASPDPPHPGDRRGLPDHVDLERLPHAQRVPGLAEKSTLVLQVYKSVGEFTTDWPSFMTLSVLALLPMVFFVFTQRHIVSGLLAGGVKG